MRQLRHAPARACRQRAGTAPATFHVVLHMADGVLRCDDRLAATTSFLIRRFPHSGRRSFLRLCLGIPALSQPQSLPSAASPAMVRAFSFQVCCPKRALNGKPVRSGEQSRRCPRNGIDRDPRDRRSLKRHCALAWEGERDASREPGDRPERIRLVLRRAAPSSAAACIRIPRLFLPSSKVLRSFEDS